MRPLAEQVQIEIAEDLAEPVGIDRLAGLTRLVDAKAVRQIARRAAVEIERGLEQSVRMTPRHRERALAGQHVDRARRRLHRPDDDGGAAAVGDRVGAEHRKWIVGAAGHDGVERVFVHGPDRTGHGLNCNAGEWYPL